MKHALGWAAHAACLASILLAIWLPFGGRGQWIATAIVLLLIGAMLLGSPAAKADRYAAGEEMSSSGPGTESPNRPTYGKRAE